MKNKKWTIIAVVVVTLAVLAYVLLSAGIFKAPAEAQIPIVTPADTPTETTDQVPISTPTTQITPTKTASPPKTSTSAAALGTKDNPVPFGQPFEIRLTSGLDQGVYKMTVIKAEITRLAIQDDGSYHNRIKITVEVEVISTDKDGLVRIDIGNLDVMGKKNRLIEKVNADPAVSTWMMKPGKTYLVPITFGAEQDDGEFVLTWYSSNDKFQPLFMFIGNPVKNID